MKQQSFLLSSSNDLLTDTLHLITSFPLLILDSVGLWIYVRIKGFPGPLGPDLTSGWSQVPSLPIQFNGANSLS